MALTERYVSSTGTDTYANSTNPATPMSLSTAFANAVAGDRINVKADGTYTRAASDTIVAGTSTSPIVFRGYLTTIGDGFQGRTGGNHALITTKMPTISYNANFLLNAGTYTIVESLNITASIGSFAVFLAANAGNAFLKSCKITNASISSAANCVVTGGGDIIDCDLSLSVSHISAAAVLVNAAGTNRILYNRITGGIGIQTGAQNFVAVGNVIYAATNHIKTTSAGGAVTAIFNTLVGSSSDGVSIVSSSTPIHHFSNNMITDNGGYGLNFNTAQGAVTLLYNRWRDNTNGNINLGTNWVAGTSYGAVTADTGGSETDYTNASVNDYTLIATSPGKGAGWTPYRDIGALQQVLFLSPFTSGSGTETLDRSLEELLREIILAQVAGADNEVMVCTSLMGAGEEAAKLPRIVIKCESQDTPELFEAGVFRVVTTLTSMTEATSQISSDDLYEMNTAIDRIIMFSDNIAALLTSGNVLTFGVVHGGESQEVSGDHLMRVRHAEIWAKLREAP